MDNPPIILFEHLDYETNKIEFSSLVSSRSRHSGVRLEPSLFRVMLGRKVVLDFYWLMTILIRNNCTSGLDKNVNHVSDHETDSNQGFTQILSSGRQRHRVDEIKLNNSSDFYTI
ncbi:hypothetical protein BDB01DRAFT_840314 [Pilobolus umbonatus]|nr:hypothetical protein BDB01DRAFT_840314 [Pilobolus umbonatus]